MNKDNQFDKYVECNYNRKFIRKVPIVIGGLYIVEPLNPLKKKYKGEKVILVQEDGMDSTRCLRVESEWHVKRMNYTDIDICDLRFVTEDLPEDMAKMIGL